MTGCRRPPRSELPRARRLQKRVFSHSQEAVRRSGDTCGSLLPGARRPDAAASSSTPTGRTTASPCPPRPLRPPPIWRQWAGPPSQAQPGELV